MTTLRNHEQRQQMKPLSVENARMKATRASSVFSSVPLSGKHRALETWLHEALDDIWQYDSHRLPINKIFQRTIGIRGAALYGVDSTSLEEFGLPPESIVRIYRAMFAYSKGLHSLMSDITAQCRNGKASIVIMLVWNVFVLLFEPCRYSQRTRESYLASYEQSQTDENRSSSHNRCSSYNPQDNETRKLYDDAQQMTAGEQDSRVWKEKEHDKTKVDLFQDKRGHKEIQDEYSPSIFDFTSSQQLQTRDYHSGNYNRHDHETRKLYDDALQMTAPELDSRVWKEKEQDKTKVDSLRDRRGHREKQDEYPSSIIDCIMNETKGLVSNLRAEYESTILHLTEDNEHAKLTSQQTQGIEADLTALKLSSEVTKQNYDDELNRRLDAEMRLQDITRALEESQIDMQVVTGRYTELQGNFANLQKENESLLKEVQETSDRVTDLERQVCSHRYQAFEWAQQKERCEKEIQNMTLENSTKATHIEEAEEKIKVWKDEVTHVTRELHHTTSELEEVRESRRNIKNEFSSLRQRCEAAEELQKSAENELRDESEKKAKMSVLYQSNLAALSAQTSKLENETRRADQAEESFQDAESKLGVLTVQHKNLEDNLTAAEEQLLQNTIIRKQLKLENEALSQEIHRITINRDILQKNAESLNKEFTVSLQTNNHTEQLLRQAKIANEKLVQQCSTERNRHRQKVTSLEKVIAEEEEIRQNLVKEIKVSLLQRQEALSEAHAMKRELQNVQTSLKETTADVDRLEHRVAAEQERSSGLQTLLDKYHATVTDHDQERKALEEVLETERQDKNEIKAILHSSFFVKEAEQKTNFQSSLSVKEDEYNQTIAVYQMQCEDLKSHWVRKQINALEPCAAAAAAESAKAPCRCESQVFRQSSKIEQLEAELTLLQINVNKACAEEHQLRLQNQEDIKEKNTNILSLTSKLEASSRDRLECVKKIEQLEIEHVELLKDFQGCKVQSTNTEHRLRVLQQQYESIKEKLQQSCKTGDVRRESSSQTHLSFQLIEAKPPFESPMRSARLATILQASRHVATEGAEIRQEDTENGLHQDNLKSRALAEHNPAAVNLPLQRVNVTSAKEVLPGSAGLNALCTARRQSPPACTATGRIAYVSLPSCPAPLPPSTARSNRVTQQESSRNSVCHLALTKVESLEQCENVTPPVNLNGESDTFALALSRKQRDRRDKDDEDVLYSHSIEQVQQQFRRQPTLKEILLQSGSSPANAALARSTNLALPKTRSQKHPRASTSSLTSNAWKKKLQAAERHF